VRTLATYSIKGGVGKTATAVNLAWCASDAGLRTLVWDLDPQGAASYAFRIKAKVKGGARALVARRRTLDEAIKATDHERLDLVPADFSFRNLDLVLDEAGKPTRQVRRLLREVRDEYDLVVLDCAPSISLVSESVFEAADALLVPLVPATLSVRTWEQLLRFLDSDGVRHRPQVLGFFSMADSRKRLHREVMDEARGRWPEMLRSVVPMAADVERMGVTRQPVLTTVPRSRAADAYRALWTEVHSRLWPGG
jgi:chromosome partitioning protein